MSVQPVLIQAGGQHSSTNRPDKPVIIDGRHASIESTNAEAREYAERGFAPLTTRSAS